MVGRRQYRNAPDMMKFHNSQDVKEGLFEPLVLFWSNFFSCLMGILRSISRPCDIGKWGCNKTIAERLTGIFQLYYYLVLPDSNFNTK